MAYDRPETLLVANYLPRAISLMINEQTRLLFVNKKVMFKIISSNFLKSENDIRFGELIYLI